MTPAGKVTIDVSFCVPARIAKLRVYIELLRTQY